MSMLKCLLYGLLCFLLLLGSGRSLPAQTPAAVGEHELKAAYLFNFTQFVEWPAEAFATPEEPFVIGLLGNTSALKDFLEGLVSGEKVQGRPLVVKHYKNVGEVKTPHILFIQENRKERLAWILKRLRGRNILTVNDTEIFLQRGGIIRLKTLDNKIQVEINQENASKAKLKISAKLLKLAEIVEPESR